MPVDHRIGTRGCQCLGRFPVLGFLRKNSDASFRQVLNQPGMVNIKPFK